MGVGKLLVNFVLATLEAEKHDVNNVNNVQCLITVSICEKLGPGEETRVAASIPVRSQMSDTQQRKDPRETYPTNSASEDDEATLRPTKKISPPAKQETALQTQKHSAPQLKPTLGRNQQPRANQ